MKDKVVEKIKERLHYKTMNLMLKLNALSENKNNRQ